jgi:hypothetical protein
MRQYKWKQLTSAAIKRWGVAVKWVCSEEEEAKSRKRDRVSSCVVVCRRVFLPALIIQSR